VLLKQRQRAWRSCATPLKAAPLKAATRPKGVVKQINIYYIFTADDSKMNVFSFFTKSIEYINPIVVNHAENPLTPLVIEVQEPTVSIDPYYSITEDWFIQQNIVPVIYHNVSNQEADATEVIETIETIKNTHDTIQTRMVDPIDTVINQQVVFDESKLLELDCDESELENIPDEELDEVVMRLLLEIGE